jgi:hypothetical protein
MDKTTYYSTGCKNEFSTETLPNIALHFPDAIRIIIGQKIIIPGHN